MLTKSKNNIPVHDRHNSHISCRIEDLKAAVERTVLTKEFEKVVVKFDDRTGLTTCVKTYSGDVIIYRKRKGRRGPTRFVKNRRPEPTNALTFIALRRGDIYVLITAFWGEGAEPEPWDERAFMKDKRGYIAAKKASEDFWSNHALIFDINTHE